MRDGEGLLQHPFNNELRNFLLFLDFVKDIHIIRNVPNF
jgi:hypothetical protein